MTGATGSEIQIVARRFDDSFLCFSHSRPFTLSNDGDDGLQSDDGIVASVTVFKANQTSAGIRYTVDEKVKAIPIST